MTDEVETNDSTEHADPKPRIQRWASRPTPSYLWALAYGGAAPRSRNENPNVAKDLSEHTPEELLLVIEEGRRQLDAESESFRNVQDRAQTLITVTLVVLAFNTGVFSRLDRATGWQGRAFPYVWGLSIVLVLSGLLLAAAVASVRGDFTAIDTTQVTSYPRPLDRALADDYAESVRLGAVTVADRTNAFQIATRYTIWGAILTAGAFMLTA